MSTREAPGSGRLAGLRAQAARLAEASAQAGGVAARAAGAAAHAGQRLGAQAGTGVQGLSQALQDRLQPTGPGFNGTPFARTVATALAARPHSRSLGSKALRPLQLGLDTVSSFKTRRRLRQEGYRLTDPAHPDLEELVHVHGRLLPDLIAFASWRRQAGTAGRQRVASETGSAVGSLHEVPVSQAAAAQGALPWGRLCVDTDQAVRAITLLDHRHLDVLVALPGTDPAAYHADLRLLLPHGLPACVSQAADQALLREGGRLHLLGDERVVVDAGGHRTQFDVVPHLCRGSLLLAGGRVLRAELWLSDRANALGSALDLLLS